MSTNFEGVERSPAGHLSLLIHYAAYRIAAAVRRRAIGQGKESAEVFREFPFLAQHLAHIRPLLPAGLDWAASFRWLEEAIAEWEASAGVHLPLKAMRDQLQSGPNCLLALLFTGIVDEDAQFGDLYAVMQPASGSRRPATGLIAEMLYPEVNAWRHCRQLMEAGVVEVCNPDAPRVDWTFRIPAHTWSAARGEEPNLGAGFNFQRMEALTPISGLILPHQERQRLGPVPALLASRQSRVLLIRGTPGCDRLAVAGAVARALSRNLLVFERALPAGDALMRQGGALAVMTDSMPVFCLDLAAGETAELPPLNGYTGPVAAVMGREGGITGWSAESALTITLNPDAVMERGLHWERAFEDREAPRSGEIAERFALPGRYIQQSARLAVSYATMSGRIRVDLDDIRLANRTINRQVLDSLAERLEISGNWGHLVVPDATREELVSLEHRCRFREPLSAALAGSIPGGLNRGVRALFEGPSGTGKTLAARILAAQLGLDIYRIDLATVVSKYIGETEKNLSRILGRAEDLDVILLLDEGDALMSKRTDVKSSNDRYANLETNYLLQRLESYTGIVVITTNFGQHIDAGFRRRFDAVVKFTLPDPEARLHLWKLHLPQGHEMDHQDLEQIGIRHALSGAQIRNSAVNASLRAMARGAGPVSLEDVVHAVRIEYRKAGSALPAGILAPAVSGERRAVSIPNSIF